MRETNSDLSFYSLAPLEVAMLVYPGFTLLDLAGPQAAWGFHGRTHLVWKSLQPVVTDNGVAIMPTVTFADCPRTPDILFVPGGFGTNAVMEDDETLAFLRDLGRKSRYITSVCSGSLILGAAGLLRGYQIHDALGVLRHAGGLGRGSRTKSRGHRSQPDLQVAGRRRASTSD